MKKLLVLLLCLAIFSPAYAKQKGKGNKHKDLPPGLERKVQSGGELPPGWQKKLAKGDVLTDDLYSHAVPLSQEEIKEFPPLQAGVRLLRIENQIIRIVGATRTILDILDGGR